MHKVCLQNKPNVTVKRLKNLSPIPRWVWSHFSNYQNSLQKHQLISEPSAIISNNSKISSKYQQFSTITVQYQKISEIICKKWHFKYVLEPVVKYTVKKVCLCLHSMTKIFKHRGTKPTGFISLLRMSFFLHWDSGIFFLLQIFLYLKRDWLCWWCK